MINPSKTFILMDTSFFSIKTYTKYKLKIESNTFKIPKNDQEKIITLLLTLVQTIKLSIAHEEKTIDIDSKILLIKEYLFLK
ncbi:MAG: hypothetical protein A3J06_01070 [Candidatus Moranbacteria bacterium RIFCSPLOWO2_02_FULL_48_19]|nr:MAG: hypothetical protein A3J06_01070 [Candidatus Moranbacteria bacterium RIFCSPLOWO2_02_FULL_48_19]OGI30313.1 MAG: hypothetical protein A3G09_02265 [Candidatus Moranbacteria bacterium RIFCSPLOWO2_12_FULL_48_12]